VKAGKEEKDYRFSYLYHVEGEKVKVLTHRPRYIETAKVSKLPEGPSSVVEPSHPATAEARVESAEEPIPKTVAEQPKT
jgi:hypothetical protein